MKPYIFRIPSFDDNNVKQFNDIANNPLIEPRAKVSIFSIVLLCVLLCLFVVGYLLFGKMLITSSESAVAYIKAVYSVSSWGIIILFLLIYNIIASCSNKQIIAIISVVINIVGGFLLLVTLPTLVGFVCMFMLWGIAYYFYQGTKNRMKSVLTKDPGPYGALIIDQNKNQLLLENLNNNQLCCVDDLCEMLKKLNKGKEIK